jgi:kynureninase
MSESLLLTAARLDEQSGASCRREAFLFPQYQGRDVVYLCGNSLGLQPVTARQLLNEELDTWADLAVEGHFQGRRPWFSYHEPAAELAAPIVGALPHEVVMMNTLTANLHLLMVSFYRPTSERYIILTEAGAFPSDRQALRSQAAHHGLNPDQAVIELAPREGEDTLRDSDILDAIALYGARLALVMMAGVQFRTGQVFDIQAISAAAHAVGAFAGFDLAHAAGNLPLNLHDDGADFAVWCSYKYLNSGPGSIGGAFVHDRHADSALPRFAGWWGHEPATRFQMTGEFHPQRGAAGWQLSNVPVFSTAPFIASARLFVEVGMQNLHTRALAMNDFFRAAMASELPGVQVVTPVSRVRGCQLSLRVHTEARPVQERLMAQGIVTDFRPPDVIRAAPVPLYNTFSDIARFVTALREVLA